MVKIERLILLLSCILPAQMLFAVKIISGPYLQNLTSDEVTVIWRTDRTATGWVEVVPDDGRNFYASEPLRCYETELGRAVTGTLHKVRVTGLSGATGYRYRVCSEEVVEEHPNSVVYGNAAATDVYNRKPLLFVTPDSMASSFRFRVVNDIHGDSAKLAALLGSVSKDGVDFVVCNGDMVNHLDNEEKLFGDFLNRAAELFAGETPLYMARGNHETRGRHATRYMRYFRTPTGMPYYSFSYGPACFIVLDTGEDKPDTDIEYSRTAFYDDYRRAQACWLAEVVDSEEFRKADVRIVIGHVPPVHDDWHGALHARKQFLPILNRAGIDLMLCGHLHRSASSEAGEDGVLFPVLVNSNEHAVDVEVADGEVKVTVIGCSGEIIKNSIPNIKINNRR